MIVTDIQIIDKMKLNFMYKVFHHSNSDKTAQRNFNWSISSSVSTTFWKSVALAVRETRKFLLPRFG